MLRRISARQFSTTIRRAADQVAPVVSPVAPKPRKVGAFRGGFLGFLLGTTFTGIGAYYYLFDEYRNANGAVLLDVVQLQDSIRTLESHVIELEKKIGKQ